MKKPTIVELAKLVNRDRKTLHHMKVNSPDLFNMLWRGYLYYLVEKDLNKK